MQRTRLAGWIIFICVATPCFSQAQGNATQATQESCRTFVQDFYSWYVPVALKRNSEPAVNFALRSKSSVFSPDLLAALKEDSQAQARVKGEIDALDFDPFLDSQDPGESYLVGAIRQTGGSCSVDVYSITSGEKSPKPAVIPELLFKEGRWLFVNFHYGPSEWSKDENLVSTLKALRDGRKQPPQ
jgi:hypothetical protein